jgi:hypothetical protein
VRSIAVAFMAFERLGGSAVVGGARDLLMKNSRPAGM